MSKYSFKLFGYFFFLLILILVVYAFINHNTTEVSKISRITYKQFVYFSGLIFFVHVLSGLRIYLFAKIFDVHLKLSESFGLAVTSIMYNYLPLQGGLASRGIYLKKIHNLTYSNFLATLSGSIVLNILGIGGLGIFALGWAYVEYNYFNYTICFMYILLILFSIFCMCLKIKEKKIDFILLKPFYRVLDGWKTIRSKSNVFLTIIVLEHLFILLMALRLLYSFSIFHHEIAFPFCLMIATFSMLSNFISFVPGALGIREAVVGAISGWLEVGMVAGVVAASMDRIMSIIWVFFWGSIFTFVFLSKTKRRVG